MVHGKVRRLRPPKSKRVRRELNNNSNVSLRTRRVVFVAGPETEIIDLVGPLQVFARATEKFRARNPGVRPIYSVEVVSASRQKSILSNCGLQITAHNTFREVRGTTDTLLVAGGSAIERDEIPIEVVRW